MPKRFTDPEAIAEDIIRDVGTHLVVGLPLHARSAILRVPSGPLAQLVEQETLNL